MSDVRYRLVLAHDHLNTWGGGERVLEVFTRRFPDAPIFTLTHDPEVLQRTFTNPLHLSLIQRMPMGARKYKWYLALIPLAVEKLKLPPCDAVLSDCSGFIKGVHVPKGAIHLCYIHTPIRYLTFNKEYFRETVPKFLHPIMPALLKYLARKDQEGAKRPHAYIANSQTTAARVKEHYGRDVDAVIFPPVDTTRFFRKPEDQVGDYYLAASRFVPYKRIDLAIEACNRLGRKLIVVGSGPEEAALRALAGPTIEFRSNIADHEFRELFAGCRALIFPALEDAGMIPIECMASGRPVLAFAKGGSLESVSDGVSGLFFDEQTPEKVVDAIERFESREWDSEPIASYALKFGEQAFVDQVVAVFNRVLEREGKKPL